MRGYRRRLVLNENGTKRTLQDAELYRDYQHYENRLVSTILFNDAPNKKFDEETTKTVLDRDLKLKNILQDVSRFHGNPSEQDYNTFYNVGEESDSKDLRENENNEGDDDDEEDKEKEESPLNQQNKRGFKEIPIHKKRSILDSEETISTAGLPEPYNRNYTRKFLSFNKEFSQIEPFWPDGLGADSEEAAAIQNQLEMLSTLKYNLHHLQQREIENEALHRGIDLGSNLAITQLNPKLLNMEQIALGN